MLDDAYLWTTTGDAEALVLDGDNEVLESSGALICSDCQVKHTQQSEVVRCIRPASCVLFPCARERLTFLP